MFQSGPGILMGSGGALIMAMVECARCGRMADARSMTACGICGASLCEDCAREGRGLCEACGVGEDPERE